jgi:hypothetical protein
MAKRYRLSASGLGVTIALGITVAIFALNGCSESETQKAANRINEGKELSKKYCAGCHKYPGPELLDKTTWEKGVLPAMALQLGLQREMGMLYADRSSVIDVDTYNKIVEFYKSGAPDTLALPKATAQKDWAMFTLKRPNKVDRNTPAMTTMIRFNAFDGHIYTGDMSNKLLAWDSKLNAKLVRSTPSAVTAANFYQDKGKSKSVFTCIGELPPNDYLKGALLDVSLSSTDTSSKRLADKLPRPVNTVAADFNKDGLTDYVICGYGNTKGALMLVQQRAGGGYDTRVVRAMPGAIQAEVGDYNNDGWPDVMCLFAQGDEGIWMFLNNKKGGFTAKNLLRFPPVYGSNSFQLVDMNNDGKKDLIYTCGDNNDYSSILKPYHGVYIFTNKGGWDFKQAYFYHINGASKAMAADFDSDGDMDIAVTAFFADFKYHPTEGFILMEQANANSFKAHEIPVNKYGRWLVMDVADVDNDGDPDVLLGNFSVFGDRLINQKGYKPEWDMHEPVIMLENSTHKK